jgi:hypothetical protein
VNFCDEFAGTLIAALKNRSRPENRRLATIDYLTSLVHKIACHFHSINTTGAREFASRTFVRRHG